MLYRVRVFKKVGCQESGPFGEPILVKAKNALGAAGVAIDVCREMALTGELLLDVYELCEPEGDTGHIYEPVKTPKRFSSGGES